MSFRVLIVEDHKVNRILLSSILEKMGISWGEEDTYIFNKLLAYIRLTCTRTHFD